jgi:hypothetical protein
MLGVGKHTVLRLLEDAGRACASYHDENVLNLRVRRLQCDEIWSFVGAKAKNVSVEKKQEGWGDTWAWTAIDADTKLCVSYLVGGRDAGWAYEFMQDCAVRIRGRWKQLKVLSAATWIMHNCRRYTAPRPMPTSADTVQPSASELT